MSNVNSKWLEQRRGRWIWPNGHLYVRADAYRLAAPGTPESEPPGWLDPSATRVRLKEAQEAEARAQEEAAQEEFERELLHLRWEVKKLKLEHELWCFEEKYRPDQPRDERGRWVEDGSATDISAARKLAPLVKEFGKWTARQFVSRYCRGSINREMPSQFENVTIADIYELAKGGDARARTCFKLLNEPRFRK